MVSETNMQERDSGIGLILTTIAMGVMFSVLTIMTDWEYEDCSKLNYSIKNPSVQSCSTLTQTRFIIFYC